MSVLVFEGFLSTPEMVEVFDETAVVQAMMDFEAALARAQAKAGVIPAAAAQAIVSLCRAELYDVAAMVSASGRAGSLALPVVRKLSETVALFDPLAAGFVHWGSSHQDLLDTAMVLQTRKALQLIEQDLLRLCGDMLDLAERHARTALLARIQLQPARVTSLRCKLLAWTSPLLRSAQALRERADAALLLQLDGAVGGASAQVSALIGQELQLPLPTMPWPTQRDGLARLAAELGVLCGSLGKLALDLALLAQTELGELLGPVACQQALAAAQRAPQRVAAMLGCMQQEQEGGLGNWPAEWAECCGLLLCTHGAVKALAQCVEGMQPQGARMLENIDAQRDLIFAEGLRMLLALVLGGARAQRCVDALVARVRQGEAPLRVLARAAVAADPELAASIVPAQLEAVFDVHAAARQADERVQAALLQARAQWLALMDSPAQ
jgi:3-carboxy-cis,cis-muconate cycloisomerase